MNRTRHSVRRPALRCATILLALGTLALSASPASPRPDARPGRGPGPRHYEYLSPRPGAFFVQPRNNLLIRFGDEIDAGSLDPAALRVVGSESGVHEGSLRLADDRRTLIFRPIVPFAWGERVEVRLRPGIRTVRRRVLPPFRYTFTVTSFDPAAAAPRALHEIFPELTRAPGWDAATRTEAGSLPSERKSEVAVEAGVACACDLEGFPEVRILRNERSGPGRVFLAPFFNGIEDGFLSIVDDRGEPIFLRRLPGAAGAFDFKRQPNGWLTYFHRSLATFYALDSNYAVVDSFRAGNGYLADLHELQLLPNGHALLMVYDRQRVAMDQVVPGGNPDAVVIGLVIQELDREKEVVFQWRSWDDMQITDMRTEFNPLTASLVDYVHGNSIEYDRDGNLLVSSRHINEITKIDRTTGRIRWRFGGNARNNEFTILGDPRGFSHQHAARRLPNGNLLLYDNGTDLDPEFSRALEYELDEERRVARLVWEHRADPPVFGGFMGNAQRHPGGGTTICWGGTFGDPKVTDLDAAGRVVWEAGLPIGHFTYRAFRFPWETSRFRTAPAALDFGPVAPGDRVTGSVAIRNETETALSIHCLHSTHPAFAAVAELPLALAPGEERTIEVGFAPPEAGVFEADLHVRQIENDEWVGRTVVLRGSGRAGAPLRVAGPSRIDPDRVAGLASEVRSPARGTVRIAYTLPADAAVTLEVFDVGGRRVARFDPGRRPAGRHEIVWNALHRRSGVYFYRLRAAGEANTGKFVLVP